MYLDFYTDFAFFALRFAVGVIFISRAVLKVAKKQEIFKKSWLNLLLALVELAGGLLIISGLWIRAVGIVLAVLMIGAIYFHIFVWKDKFCNGWEIVFLLFGALMLLSLTGGGNWRII